MHIQNRFHTCKVAQTLGVPIVPISSWLAQLEALATFSKSNGTTAITLYHTIDLSATKAIPRTSNENAFRESPTLGTSDRERHRFLAFLLKERLVHSVPMFPLGLLHSTT